MCCRKVIYFGQYYLYYQWLKSFICVYKNLPFFVKNMKILKTSDLKMWDRFYFLDVWISLAHTTLDFKAYWRLQKQENIFRICRQFFDCFKKIGDKLKLKLKYEFHLERIFLLLFNGQRDILKIGENPENGKNLE